MNQRLENKQRSIKFVRFEILNDQMSNEDDDCDSQENHSLRLSIKIDTSLERNPADRDIEVTLCNHIRNVL